MYLTRMESKNAREKYTSVESLLKDVELICTNAYIFNSDPSNVEVRIMADMFLHYFQYLLRNVLLQFVSKACDAVNAAVSSGSGPVTFIAMSLSMIRMILLSRRKIDIQILILTLTIPSPS